ncbi:MAG TPA: T9SS type A sorting domain-containing protein, partial [Flavobacteriales bacterium]
GFVFATVLPLTPSHAQDRVVIAGNRMLDFNAPAGQVAVSPLPTPGGAGNYSGSVAQYCQNAQYDVNGQLLFFIIDGNIYDRMGYLIADNDASPNCQQCLMRGTRQVGITLVPGTCDKYYIVLAKQQSNADIPPSIGYAILDMGATSAYSTSRRGRVLDAEEVESTFPVAFDQYLNGVLGGSLVVPTEPPVQFGVLDNWNSNSGHGDIQFRIHEGTGPGEVKTLFVRDAARFYQAPITSQGIGNLSVCSPDYTAIFNQPSDDYLYFLGGFDLRHDASGALRIAISSNNSHAVIGGPVERTIWLGTVVYTGGVPVVDLQHEVNTNLSNANGSNIGRVRDVMFSPNGRYVYFTQNFPPYIGYVDFTNPTVAQGLSIPSASSYSLGVMNANIAPNGLAPAIYFPKTNGMGCLVGVDAPGTATWQANVPVSSALGTMPISQNALTDPPVQTHFLGDMQVWSDRQITQLQQPVCCVSNNIQSNIHVIGTLAPTGLVTWNPGSNTLGIGASSTAVFSQDFVVPSGARLTVNNMTWRFAENARLIVQPGGFVRFTNSTLTSLDCAGARWPGVEAQGNSAQTQDGSATYPTTQPRLMLYNTVVENALIGVLVGARTQLTPVLFSSTSGGGVVNTSQNSRFINCREGVRFQRYQGTVPNRSSFSATSFTVNAAYPATYDFQRHAYLWRVDGVRFTACHFKNERVDNLFTSTGSLALGHGIYSLDAQYTVEAQCPTCSEPQLGRSTFIGLDHGIHALGGPSALYTFQVDQAAFTDNICGVYSSGVTGFVVKRSNFSIGKRNVTLTNPEELPTTTPYTPGWGNHHRGVYSYSGYGFSVDDNSFTKTVGSPANRLTEGVVIGYSRDHSDYVFRNTGSNLTNGFVGEGICASEVPSSMPTTGLQFICNTNQNNNVNLWSRKITGTTDANSHTIRTHQGATNRPADNVFDGWNGTGGKWDFLVTTTVNPITYWHRNSTTPYMPQNNFVTNFNMNPSAVTSIPQNNCSSKIPGGGVDGMVLETMDYLEGEKQIYENLKHLAASGPEDEELQRALGVHHANLCQASHRLIAHYTRDTLNSHIDDVREAWSAIPTLGARYAEALGLVQQERYDEAKQLVNDIPSRHSDIGAPEREEQLRMLELIGFVQGIAASGRSDAELTLAEKDRLESLVSGAQDRPAVWAQNLLCFHYGRCRTPWSGGVMESGEGNSTATPLVNGGALLMGVFPNPTNGQVTVTLPEMPTAQQVQLRVMDMLGKEVDRHFLKNGQHQFQFDAQGFAAGTYFVELILGDAKVETQKLIVQP